MTSKIRPHQHVLLNLTAGKQKKLEACKLQRKGGERGEEESQDKEMKFNRKMKGGGRGEQESELTEEHQMSSGG